MKRKFIEDQFIKVATDSKTFVEFDKNLNGYVAIKYFKKVKRELHNWSNGNKYVFLGDGYSIIEYLPVDKNYNCRAFFDNYNRPIGYYFDINNGSGELDGKHWYDDLWLDVIVTTPHINNGFNYIFVDDEDEFEQAHKDGLVDDELYKLGFEWMNSLIAELKESKNNIVNRSCFDIYNLKQKYNLPTEKF